MDRRPRRPVRLRPLLPTPPRTLHTLRRLPPSPCLSHTLPHSQPTPPQRPHNTTRLPPPPLPLLHPHLPPRTPAPSCAMDTGTSVVTTWSKPKSLLRPPRIASTESTTSCTHRRGTPIPRSCRATQHQNTRGVITTVIRCVTIPSLRSGPTACRAGDSRRRCRTSR